MGVVYKAQDLKLERFVALKFLPPHSELSTDDIDRFRQEANAVATFNHPNIATIYDIDEDEGTKFLVLEYLSGGTLYARIHDAEPSPHQFPISQVLEFGIQIAEGLADAHKHGIIHRDIKSENIMLTGEGRIRITDFGLAKLKGSSHAVETESVAGTTAYMSPEQIRGEEVDHRTDIFSFGIVLYELSTGHLPFRGEHQAAISYSIINEPPIPLESFRSDIPKVLSAVIGSCLEKEPNNRYQHAEEIVRALRTIQMEDILDRHPVVRRSTRRLYIATALVITVLAFFYFFFPSKTNSGLNKSVAVIPFKSFSENVEDQYFSDGITEDVITQLSKIADIKVISHTSMMRYKNTDKKIPEIGKELNVGAVLEGSLRRSGDQVRIVAQLINASTDEHLWAETYDEALPHILEIQSKVAQQIASALQARLSSQDKERIGRKASVNIDAYDAYLKGRYYLNKRTPDDLKKAIEYFQTSMDKDPNSALAYTGMSDAYTLIGNFDLRLPHDVYPKAKAAATKALEIDNHLGEAYISLAFASMHYDWDWAATEREFKQGIELNPNSAAAHSWYALYLTLMGRTEDADRYRKRAQELDPLSLVVACDGALEFYFERKYDIVIQRCQQILDDNPLFVAASIPLGGAYLHKLMYQQAIDALSRASMFSKGHPITVAATGYAYALCGRKEDANQMVDLLKERAQEEYVPPYWIAVVYAGLREDDQAFQWLEKAYNDRDGSMVFLKVDPVWDNLRTSQQFKSLLKRMKLDQPEMIIPSSGVSSSPR